MDDLSSQFLTAFNSIETWMRNELDADESEGFTAMQRKLEPTHAGFRIHSTELKRLAKLRNLIVHLHNRDRPFAVPTLHSVEQLEKIAKQLLSPPSLLSVAASPVEQCRRTDPLGICVRKMHEGVFSQLPIVDDGKCIGLLTAETIARWLATEFVGDMKGIVGELSVDEVIQHQEDSDNYKFLPRAASVVDALSAFDEFLRRGKRLEAVLITHNGILTESILGIVTINDVPKLNRAIQGQ